ncbi:MAG: nickel pincer cofactor biosynthesis protein LarC [Oscillibacter sp.]
MKTLYLECNMGAAGDMLLAALYELLDDKAGFLQTMNHLCPGVTVEAQPAATCGIAGTHMDVRVHGEREEDQGHPHALPAAAGQSPLLREPPAHEHEHAHEHGHGHEHAHEHGHEHELEHEHEHESDDEHGHEHGHEHELEHEHGHEQDHAHGHEREHEHEHGHGHGHDHEHEHNHEHEHGHEHAHEHEHEHHHAGPGEIAAILDRLPVPETVRANAKAVYDRIAAAESAAHGVPVTEVHFHELGALDAVADVTGVCLALHLLAPDAVVVSPIHVGCGLVRCAHGLVPVPAPATARLLTGIPCYGGEISGELCTPTGAALLAFFAQRFGPMPVMTPEKIGYGIGTKEFPAANCVRAFWGETGQADQAQIVELCCHLDDMTAEALAFAGEQLLAQGALDVASAPITMKKGRAGIAFTVLCRPADEERLAQAILRETSTNGVRAKHCGKYILTPSLRTVETRYGPIRVKCADGLGIHREKPEYEDVAAAARREKLPFGQVWDELFLQIKGENRHE